MGVLKQKTGRAPFSEEDRKIPAWDNARRTSDPYLRYDYRDIPMDWDQYNKRSIYGWFVEYIVPLEDGGKDEATNLRARHWCASREEFEGLRNSRILQ
jgi:hypothetical protein